MLRIVLAVVDLVCQNGQLVLVAKAQDLLHVGERENGPRGVHRVDDENKLGFLGQQLLD